MQDIYNTFDFNKIKEKIDEYIKTELGRTYVSELKMFNDEREMNNALGDLLEMTSIIIRFGKLPIANSANALRLISLAKKTGLLSPSDLSIIAEDVLTIEKIINYFKKIDLVYPRIKAKTEEFIDLTNLEKEIHKVITPSLTIFDNATPELKEIRSKIKRLETKLNEKVASLAFTYASYLNDDNPTLRDGHFVLPVKTKDKSKVPGIIFDVSDTGATTFIEPLEICNINNEMTSLKVSENEEVRKILKTLTALVLLQENEIISNNKLIAELDFLSAKSMYANEIDGLVATNVDTQRIELIEAKHPLIDPKKVVANSFSLDQDKRLIIISGPNAGGKTVSLKTVGLLVVMNQCGLAIPVKKATLSYFKNIYIDIGDNQSLSDNLSTFSAHMKQIAEITSLVGGKDLVLLDELGTGTDPKEGEAIALSVTKYLEKKHPLCMISSHFEALKEYAFVSNNIDSASMIFDEENLLPTYRFYQSGSGHSYALYVAKKYGISLEIIKDAQEYLESLNVSETSKLMDILTKKIDENTKLEIELKKQLDEINIREKSLEVNEKNLSIRKDKLLEDVKKEKDSLLSKAKSEISSVISKLNNTELKLHEVIDLKKEIEDLEESNDIDDIYNEDIKLNDYVSVPSLNIFGRVTRIKGNKAQVSGDNNMSFDVSIDKLHKTKKVVNRVMPIKKSDIEKHINTTLGLELKLIGMRYEEAQDALIKYLDNCRVKNISTVRIIHGFGSGVLRKMTRVYLDKQKDLTYRSGGEHEGGSGATVVMFKK